MRGASLRIPALLLLAASAAHGSFFMRLGGSALNRLEQIGGTPVYRTSAVVNGSAANISVIGFDRPAEETGPAVAAALKLEGRGFGGAFLAARRDGGTVRRVLLLPAPEASRCTVWLIEQPDDGGRAATAPPPEMLPCDDATPLFWVTHDASRSQLVLAETALAPSDAAESAQRRLTGAGWAAVKVSGGLSVYSREGRACIVQSVTDPATSRTRIAVLQQGGATR